MRALLFRRRYRPAGYRVGAVLLAVLLVLTAASCGGQIEEPAAEPNPSPTTEPSPEPATQEVQLFFVNHRRGDLCTDVFPVTRVVDAEDVVRATLEALLAGPTEVERATGSAGPFSPATADTLLEVEVTDGQARVTFDGSIREAIPDAATSSCTADRVVAQLDRTLLAVDGITATEYLLDGGPAFDAWLWHLGQAARPPEGETERATPPPAPATEPPADETEPADPPAPPDPEPTEPRSESEPEPTEPPRETTEPKPATVDLDAGWTARAYDWPISPGCCGEEDRGPVSPDGPLPATGWPTDGFYAVGVSRAASDPDTLRLTISRYVAMEEVDQALCFDGNVRAPCFEDVEDFIVPAKESIVREVAIADLAAVLVPIDDPDDGQAVAALHGQPGALARLLRSGIDPAYRRWVYDPIVAGTSGQAVAQDLQTRSADATFPFRTGFVPDDAFVQLFYRGPLRSELLAFWGDLSTSARWLPGHNGLYGWRPVTLEVRDGRPVLHLWAGQLGG
jgi:hypothetical protein